MNLHIACAHRSLLDNFLPSSSHVISGVGLPDATHFRNTDGPGCRVSSLNACRICGGSTTKKKISYTAMRPDYIHAYIHIHKTLCSEKVFIRENSSLHNVNIN